MPDNTKDQENQTARKGDSAKPAEVKIGLLAWTIMIAIIAVLSTSGFVLGRLFAGAESTTVAPQASEEKPAEDVPGQMPQSPQASTETWYYNDLEPVVVNPDEPGATRFVRVGLILEIGNELPQDKAKSMIQGKNPLLINWLNLYFKGLSLDQMENERDMKRILSQICDGFNEILFPDAKPQIKNVLIREFNIQ